MQNIKIALAKISWFLKLRTFYFVLFLGVPKAPTLILSPVKPHAFCSMYAGNVGFSSEISPSCPEENGSLGDIYF